MSKRKSRCLAGLVVLLSFLLASCGATPTASPLPPSPASPSAPPSAAPSPSPLPTLPPSPSSPPSAAPSPTPLPPTPTAEPALPPVVGTEPSPRVAAFYYPWYRTKEVDVGWVHWNEPSFHPPMDISSDYYPQLGAYSSLDPAVVSQHFAWLREAGVGVIVSSWWGQRSNEDDVVPLLLEMGERYGIQVAFHVEPYAGRSATALVSAVRYLYERYGDHPAFFRTTAASRWSPDDRAKGMFLLWAARFPESGSSPVEASYWREAADAIHALPDGGLVIADVPESEWVDGGHFDGLYNYAVLQLTADSYSWARTLPPDAWYVPGVLPGFSAVRIGYDPGDFVARRDGEAYNERWQAALGTGVEPALVVITSFNEWHEGSQIEPAAIGVDNDRGYAYETYGALPPDGYLSLTRQWVDRFGSQTWPAAYRMRFRVVTSSDWTTFGLVDGGGWLRPVVISASPEAKFAGPSGARFELTQPLARAEAGGTVEMVVEILLTGMEQGGSLVFEIGRGHLGSTTVELAKGSGAGAAVIASQVWDGIVPGDLNALQFKVPVSSLIDHPIPFQ